MLESFLKKQLAGFKVLPFLAHKKLLESICYTLFSSGKRFRPLLVFHTAMAGGVSIPRVVPWAGAIELIHTASLIHDDLPIMDNSLHRRRKATNHRLFGEDIALLAGNCLWIEAFNMLSPFLKDNPYWLSILCQGAGFEGLMGGQALDLKPPFKKSDHYYQHLYSMKTGALMRASMKGVTTACPSNKALNKVAKLMGEAFQLADDLQDKKEDKHSYFFMFGEKKTKNKLKNLSLDMIKLIEGITKAQGLKKLILFNSERGGVTL